VSSKKLAETIGGVNLLSRELESARSPLVNRNLGGARHTSACHKGDAAPGRSCGRGGDASRPSPNCGVTEVLVYLS